jgi:hypothetical protein
MSPGAHRIYIGVFVVTILFSLIYLITTGIDYYSTSLEERFYHPEHTSLKPSGPFGHGYGIVGTIMIIVGVASYMIRKRSRRFSRLGVLKYWLEFHIFLCVLGPILVLFHTAFKFGGIVSVSFWSMVIVVLSGVIGRFIYIQIPRTIQGRELSLNELHDMQTNLGQTVGARLDISTDSVQSIQYFVDQASMTSGGWLRQFFQDRRTLGMIRDLLKKEGSSSSDIKWATRLVRNELTLKHRISRLRTMQKWFRYWHVAHLPFAIVMLVIMIIHVGVTLAFGYRWIF